MAVASSPVTAWTMTPPAATASNTPSMTTQWKWKYGLRLVDQQQLTRTRLERFFPSRMWTVEVTRSTVPIV